MGRTHRTLLSLSVALGLLGCGLSTEPVQLQDFQWLAVDNPSTVIDGMDAAAFQGDVAVLGQLRTPTLCYRLTSSLTVAAPTVTVRIIAQQNDSPNCGNQPGGYQYTAAIRGLDDGDYTVRVIHSVPGSPDKEFTKAVSVR
jgi:hypothetical protein